MRLEASKYSIAPASAIFLKILDTSAVIGNVGHVSLLAHAVGAVFTTTILILCKYCFTQSFTFCLVDALY